MAQLRRSNGEPRVLRRWSDSNACGRGCRNPAVGTDHARRKETSRREPIPPLRLRLHRVLARRGRVRNRRLRTWRLHTLPPPCRHSDQCDLVGHLYRVSWGEPRRLICVVHRLGFSSGRTGWHPRTKEYCKQLPAPLVSTIPSHSVSSSHRVGTSPLPLPASPTRGRPARLTRRARVLRSASAALIVGPVRPHLATRGHATRLGSPPS
jgi:hypothetical protein